MRVGGYEQRLVAAALLTWIQYATAADPFATTVIEYAPAPGQFVNVSEFDDPAEALGPPAGGGTANADNSSQVSLGGFGGSITLGFDHTVMDDAANPRGLDAIVFGNAFWSGGNHNRHWAECAYIEISRDVNGNALADDPWYLITGSHIFDPANQIETQTWDDDTADATNPPVNPLWIPPGESGVWQTTAFHLPSDVFGGPVVLNPNGLSATAEGIVGYADYSPTLLLGDLDADNVVDDLVVGPATFYTVPDDPFTAGVSPGSGGGDAFDIAWAVDAETFAPAALDGFDFIRLTNGVNALDPFLGEMSPEIDAVADVEAGPAIAVPSVPTASTWSALCATLLVTATGTLAMRRTAAM